MTLPTRKIRMIDHEAQGAIIRRLRQQHGITLQELATEMGFSRQFMCGLEKGHYPWNPMRDAKARACIAILAKFAPPKQP